MLDNPMGQRRDSMFGLFKRKTNTKKGRQYDEQIKADSTASHTYTSSASASHQCDLTQSTNNDTSSIADSGTCGGD